MSKSNNILLEENGSTINNSYEYIKRKNLDLYHQTNAKSLSPIVDSLNQNFKKLNFVQNQYNVLNNLNQEALYKKEHLLKLHNDDLAKQLHILDIIQSNISNKDRLIIQTDLSIADTNININLSIIVIILSFILFVSVILYGNRAISHFVLSNIFIIIIIFYVLILMCIYNVLYLRTVLKSLFSKELLRKAAYELKYLGEKAYSDAQNEVNKLKTDWVDANCNCPVVSEESDVPDTYTGPENVIIKEIPGIFYYDGTAPQQLLLPTPDPFQLDLKQQIDWPDYSPDGSVKYNPNTKKNEYTNKNYYNFQHNKVPIVMGNPNFLTKPLTNSTTYTTNL